MPGGGDCDYLCLKICPNVRAGDETITIKDNKAYIDPASCGLCEKCISECSYNAIEIIEERISCQKIKY